MVALIRAHFPERQTGTVEGGPFLDGRFEEGGLAGGVFGDEAFDEALERAERRTRACGLIGGRGAGRQTAGQAMVTRRRGR